MRRTYGQSKCGIVHRWVSAFLLLLLAGALNLGAALERLETKDLRLIYFGGIHSFIAPYVAQCFENAITLHRQTFGYQSREKTTVFLHDFGDYGNGGTSAIPNNRIFIGIAPLNYVMDIINGNERMNWMMHHELVHLITGDQAAPADRFFRTLFSGKVLATADNPLSLLYSYLTTPRDYTPRWFQEGIAIFMETWRAGGLGRAQGAYDEMAFRALVQERAEIFDLLGLESAGTRINFQVGVNAYLYGGRFFCYLALQHGPEKLIQWVARSKGSSAYFATQFRHVFGRPLSRAWADWIQWERGFQQANLERLGRNPFTPFKAVGRQALGYTSRAFYDPAARKIYVAVNYPGQVAHIAAIDVDSGQRKKICTIKGPDLFFVSSLAYDRSRGILFYTTDNDDWRDLNQVDIKTGRTRLLLKDARIGDLVFNAADRSLWGVRHFNGISTLVRIPSPYREWNQIYSWPYGKDIYDIDISPDGRSLVAALTEINGRQSLILMNTSKLLGGDAGFEALSDFENSSPANFVFAEDGNTLYGSSYYSGVSNIYRCDLKTKEIRILSNCDTGLFKPLPLSPDSLLAFRYTSTGLLPVIIPSQLEPKASSILFLGTEIVNKYPVLKSWEAPPPSSVDINKLTVAQGRYALLSHLGLRSLYPIVEGYKESLAYGLRLDLSDPVGLNNLDLTLSYSPDTSLRNSEKVHLKLNLAFSDWKISLSHNNADFYDIFGSSKTNTKTSFKGDALELLYKKSLIFDEPNRTMDYSVHLAGYFNLERLPDYQNVLASFNRLFSLTLNYNYKYQRASLGAVDYERGFQWQSYLSSSYVNERLYPRLYTNLDLGFPLPLRHSSIWLRSSFGRSFANRKDPLDPFPNFYFGGFGNTWIDHLAQRRYRNFYSFPGVDINSVGGWNYAKALLEWNLPPLVFKRLGFPFFYANWASLSLFSSALATNVGGTGERQLLDLGGQLDIRLIALSNYQFTLSLGYAWAFEKRQPNTTEWMVSLKIH